MFRFGFVHALFGLLLLPLLGAFLWFAATRTRQALERFGEGALMRKLTESVSRRGRLAKQVLVVAAVLALVVALARPQFGSRIETVRRRGADVVVALDLSTSMLAQDISPNRLAKAKLTIAQLIDHLDGDRVGLVAFAGNAFVQSPLTTDYAAANLFLNAMDPGIMDVQGTNLGAALTTALDAFDERAGQDRVLVLITDGEDHEGEIDAAVERAAKAGVRIYTVGMGSAQGVPIPAFDAAGNASGFKRDARGAVVTTRLDEDTLRRIAERTGGHYYHATPRGSELDQLAGDLAGAQKRELEARQVTRFEEQFQLFVGLALALLVAEVLIPARRRRSAAWTGRLS
jgi:Ca-activated chloride channel family protein